MISRDRRKRDVGTPFFVPRAEHRWRQRVRCLYRGYGWIVRKMDIGVFPACALESGGVGKMPGIYAPCKPRLDVNWQRFCGFRCRFVWHTMAKSTDGSICRGKFTRREGGKLRRVGWSCLRGFRSGTTEGSFQIKFLFANLLFRLFRLYL